MSDGDIITALGGAVGSLFTSQGNAAEATSYTAAAQLDEQNAQLTAASTRIQETQTARSVTQSLGTTQADVAGAGFTESGSALDLLKSSAQQGALATSLVNIQGAINENAYAAEAGANMAKAKAANEAQTAGTITAIAAVGGALVNGLTGTGPVAQLASAGKTVVQGANAVITNPSDPLAGFYGVSGGATTYVNAAGDSVAAGTPGAIEVPATQLSSGSITPEEAAQLFQNEGGGLSTTDTAIQQGATINTSTGTIGLTPGTVLPEGATSDAAGVITTADGTTYAAGTTIAADGTVTSASGVSIAASADAIPAGATVAADGTVTAADGTVFGAGTSFAADGSVLAADGSTIAASAAAIPTGATIAADGAVTLANGAVLDAGTTIAADGSVLAADGSVLAASVDAIPAGFSVAADGTILDATGAAIDGAASIGADGAVLDAGGEAIADAGGADILGAIGDAAAAVYV